MRAVQRAVRALGRDNQTGLAELYAYANSLGLTRCTAGTFKGEVIPVTLSKVRILDILLWADAAIHGSPPHQLWAAWSKGETE